MTPLSLRSWAPTLPSDCRGLRKSLTRLSFPCMFLLSGGAPLGRELSPTIMSVSRSHSEGHGKNAETEAQRPSLPLTFTTCFLGIPGTSQAASTGLPIQIRRFPPGPEEARHCPSGGRPPPRAPESAQCQAEQSWASQRQRLQGALRWAPVPAGSRRKDQDTRPAFSSVSWEPWEGGDIQELWGLLGSSQGWENGRLGQRLGVLPIWGPGNEGVDHWDHAGHFPTPWSPGCQPTEGVAATWADSSTQ